MSSQFKKPIPANRKNDLAAIHIMQAKLGMTPDDAEALKRATTGICSSAAMSYEQRGKYRAVLTSLVNKGQPLQPPKEGWQAYKIGQLWQQLGAIGALHRPDVASLRQFVLAMSSNGVSDARFLQVKDAIKITEALKAWLKREQKKQADQQKLNMSKASAL